MVVPGIMLIHYQKRDKDKSGLNTDSEKVKKYYLILDICSRIHITLFSR